VKIEMRSERRGKKNKKRKGGEDVELCEKRLLLLLSPFLAFIRKVPHR
jgi:hypothetical protein